MKNLLMYLILALALPTGIQAQQVTAEKKASDLSDVIKPTASVSARTYTLSLPGKQDDHYLQVRTIFGANILKDKYVLSFESRYKKARNAADIKNTVNYLTVAPKAYQIGALALGGFFQQIVQPSQPTVNVLALSADAAKEVVAGAGSFKGELYLEGDYMLSARPTKTNYKSESSNQRGLSLSATKDAKSGKWEGDKHKPDLYTEFDQVGSFSPAKLKNLNLSLTNYLHSNYKEVVVVDDDGKQVSSSYAQTNDTETVFTLAYKLSNILTLASDTGVRRDGLYEKRSVEKSREDYYTLVRLDATLL